MAKDKILVIDLELTCYEDNKFPEKEVPDIIEIGIAEIDIRKKEIIRRKQFYVKPERSTISAYCTSLTGITPQIIRKQGIDFKEACRLLIQKFGSTNKAWAGFGDDILSFKSQVEYMLYEQLKEYIQNSKNPEQTEQNIWYNDPTSYSYIDISLLAKSRTWDSLSLDKTMEKMGLQFIGRKHSAYDDAYNTARVLLELLK